MSDVEDLFDAVFNYPAIDNHAHPLLTETNRNAHPLQGMVSEADGDALDDARYTLASYRATQTLSKLLVGLSEENIKHTWDDLARIRDEKDYFDLCQLCFKRTGIQTILLDDGLNGAAELAEPCQWHDQLTTSPCKRIVRIESEAENILKDLLGDDSSQVSTSIVSVVDVLGELLDRFKAIIHACAQDGHVASFKSVVCYRTGLDIASSAPALEDIENAMLDLIRQYKTNQTLRLQQKALDDHLVRITLQIAGQHHKPVQFHTGFGDNDVQSTKCSPTYMQPVVEAYPNTPIVLLHAGYPYTREAGYLTSVYKNVYLDLGLVFPELSCEGQHAILRQVLELAPTNKVLFSTDGHWWPEYYYLATHQARSALYEILKRIGGASSSGPIRAIEIAHNILFHNANRLYNLGLEPNTSIIPNED